MLPFILYSQNEKETQLYIQKFVKTHQIASSDMYNFIPEKEAFSMDEVRSILRIFYIQFPTERVFIFNQFGNTSWEVQNMLLKTLETDNEANYIFLLTSNLYALLPTIRSRAQIVAIGRHTVFEKEKIIPPLLDFILKEKKRNPLFHEQLLNIKKDEALIYLDDFIYYFSLKMKKTFDPVFSEILTRIFFVKNIIEYNNINITLAMDNLLLFIDKKVTINR